MKDFLAVMGGLLACLLAVALVAAVWWQTPTLRVDTDGSRAIAHMELMGEYPSNIRSIEISDVDRGVTLWRIESRGDFFQIHSVPLRVGANATDVQLFWGLERQIVPEAKPTFELAPRTAYRIRICPDAWLGLCQSASFRLAS